MSTFRQVVISRYGEDISWADGFAHVHVYNKGGTVPGAVHTFSRLDNVGREAHSYLNHICSYYNGLADVTLFCQGRVDDHFPWPDFKIDVLFDMPAEADAAGMRLCRGLVEWDQSGRLVHYGKWAKMAFDGSMRLSRQSFAAWWRKWVGADLLPGKGVTYFPGSILAVRRDAILSRPRSFWMDLMWEVSDHANPEEAYFLERAWLYLFQVPLNRVAFAV